MKEQLARDHGELDLLFAELRVAFEAGDIREIHLRLDLFWARLAVHIRAEHLQLFPAIVRALRGDHEADVGDAPSLAEVE